LSNLTVNQIDLFDIKYRPNWHRYFTEISKVISIRSGCIRRKIGAVLVKNNSIISTGYNNTVAGALNCFEGGCARCSSDMASGEGYDNCICIHAEANAIYNAVKNGKALKGSTLYITDRPCKQCILACISSGIERIIYLIDPVPVGMPLIDDNMLDIINDNIEIYSFEGEEDECLELCSLYHG